jgi:hypothetical protein
VKHNDLLIIYKSGHNQVSQNSGWNALHVIVLETSWAICLSLHLSLAELNRAGRFETGQHNTLDDQIKQKFSGNGRDKHENFVKTHQQFAMSIMAEKSKTNCKRHLKS